MKGYCRVGWIKGRGFPLRQEWCDGRMGVFEGRGRWRGNGEWKVIEEVAG